MITPIEGEGDLVGGVVHDIVGARIGRDLVSIGASTKGALVRNVTVTKRCIGWKYCYRLWMVPIACRDVDAGFVDDDVDGL